MRVSDMADEGLRGYLAGGDGSWRRFSLEHHDIMLSKAPIGDTGRMFQLLEMSVARSPEAAANDVMRYASVARAGVLDTAEGVVYDASHDLVAAAGHGLTEVASHSLSEVREDMISIAADLVCRRADELADEGAGHVRGAAARDQAAYLIAQGRSAPTDEDTVRAVMDTLANTGALEAGPARSLRFLEDPEAATALADDVLTLPPCRQAVSRWLAQSRAEARELEALERDPEASRVAELMGALRARFGDLERSRSRVLATFARDGHELRVQVPVELFARACPGQELSYWELTDAQRAHIDQEFRVEGHHQGEIRPEDVMRLEYRGRDLFSAPEDVIMSRTEGHGERAGLDDRGTGHDEGPGAAPLPVAAGPVGPDPDDAGGPMAAAAQAPAEDAGDGAVPDHEDRGYSGVADLARQKAAEMSIHESGSHETSPIGGDH